MCAEQLRICFKFSPKIWENQIEEELIKPLELKCVILPVPKKKGKKRKRKIPEIWKKVKKVK